MNNISIQAPLRNCGKKELSLPTINEYATRRIAEKFAISNLSLAARITILAGIGEPEARS